MSIRGETCTCLTRRLNGFTSIDKFSVVSFGDPFVIPFTIRGILSSYSSSLFIFDEGIGMKVTHAEKYLSGIADLKYSITSSIAFSLYLYTIGFRYLSEGSFLGY